MTDQRQPFDTFAQKSPPQTTNHKLQLQFIQTNINKHGKEKTEQRQKLHKKKQPSETIRLQIKFSHNNTRRANKVTERKPT